MRKNRFVAVLAGTGAVALLAFATTSAQQRAERPAVDPLFARGANCTPPQAGRPVLLARTPSNGWALRGLMGVYRQKGDAVSLRLVRQRFQTTWLGEDKLPALALL